ncbi:hypothetical protein IZ6_24970 [Terrihabitans soli]|uniref:Uncharacterized protein n=1 Tax=Terrihabitans soli TaxID=708113 RepID=A0A6S6QWY8_9HYPH|nr:hypothetical protein [Terrihabitans soli]BCJ91762.1 hypothetical protein IZ6_24970 [Terrihabitans soli]
MSITHNTAVRNLLAGVVKTAHETGGGTAKLRLRDSATTVVDFNLAATPFGAASSGTITANSLPIEAEAVASGEIDNFITLDKAGTQILAGSVTAVGMGGDIEVTNTNVANGQDCELETLTYTSPL